MKEIHIYKEDGSILMTIEIDSENNLVTKIVTNLMCNIEGVLSGGIVDKECIR